MRGNRFSEWVRAHRKMTISFLVLSFFSLIACRLVFFHSTTDAGEVDWFVLVNQILDGLISTIVVSFVVAVTLWWTKEPLERIPPGYEILSNQITLKLEAAAADSDEWEYVGHTARYTRNKVFASLQSQSKSTNRQINVRVVIIDPSKEELCGYYAKYRNSSRSKEMFQKEWDVDVVRSELLATIIKCLRIHFGPDRISCEVRFRDFLSQYRYDLSSNQVMVTQEDPQEPAYQYPRGSRFFEYCKRENHLMWQQASSRDFREAISCSLDNKESVVAFLSDVFHDCRNIGELAGQAFDLLEHDSSPYA